MTKTPRELLKVWESVLVTYERFASETTGFRSREWKTRATELQICIEGLAAVLPTKKAKKK